MGKKKIAAEAVLFAAVLILVFPVLLLAAGSFLGKEELMESYGSVLYSTDGTLTWKLIPMYPTLSAYVRLLLDSPDFFVMFWNSCIQVFPGKHGLQLYGTVGFQAAGYPFVHNPPGNFCGLSGVSSDKIF